MYLPTTTKNNPQCSGTVSHVDTRIAWEGRRMPINAATSSCQLARTNEGEWWV